MLVACFAAYSLVVLKSKLSKLVEILILIGLKILIEHLIRG